MRIAVVELECDVCAVLWCDDEINGMGLGFEEVEREGRRSL